MNEILKMTHEEFIDSLKSTDLGYKKSLLNLLKSQYEQCRLLKDSLVLVLSETPNMKQEDKDKHDKSISDLYLTLQILEDKHNLVQAMIEEVK